MIYRLLFILDQKNMATHAVVTGGGSGIGLSIASALRTAGCEVTIMGRDVSKLAAAKEANSGFNPVTCDVADEKSVASAFEAAKAKKGSVSILVNCAGIVRTAPFLKQSNDDWGDMWRTNVMGCVNAVRAVLPDMQKAMQGRVINIASTASLKGYGYVSAYTATKHAVLGLTRSLALELAGTKITVNAICPGYTNTDIIKSGVAKVMEKTGRTYEEAVKSFTSSNPQGRLIEPTEIAATVLWLIADTSGSITGQAIAIAGGEVM